MHFYDVASDGIVDDACYDRLPAFGFESMLITVELIAMTTYIMVATRLKYQVITTWTCLVVNNYVAIFCLPNEIYVTTNQMAILIQMTEGLFVMALDGFTIASLQCLNQVVP